MKKKDITIKKSKGKIEIIISFPNIKEAIERIEKMLKDLDVRETCKYCGGEVEYWPGTGEICLKCGKKQ